MKYYKFISLNLIITLYASLLYNVTIFADELLTTKTINEDFLKIIKRNPVPLNPVFSTTSQDDILINNGYFYTDINEKVPTLIIKLISANGKLPVVIVMHGTGDKKEDVGDKMAFFARHGYLAVSIDARYHGERVQGGAHKNFEYNQAILKAWSSISASQEHPLVFDTAWDTTRLVDYLVTRNDVDKEKIGILGISMGGMESIIAAAIDYRIKVTVAAISLQSYRWSLDNKKWQARADLYKKLTDQAASDMGKSYVSSEVLGVAMTKLMPGILDEFDGPSMVRLIAPRPLLILNGAKDPLCPIESTMIVYKAAKAIYQQSGEINNLNLNVSNEGHTVTSEQLQLAKDWFDLHLK